MLLRRFSVQRLGKSLCSELAYPQKQPFLIQTEAIDSFSIAGRSPPPTLFFPFILAFKKKKHNPAST